MNQDLLELLESETLSCEGFEKLLDYYLDDELGGELLKRFEQHRSSCETCASLAGDMQQVVLLAQSLAQNPIPVSVRERLRRRLEEELGVPFPTPRLYLVK